MTGPILSLFYNGSGLSRFLAQTIAGYQHEAREAELACVFLKWTIAGSDSVIKDVI